MSMRPLAASLACVLLFGPVLTSRAQSQAPWIPDPYFQSWPENRAKVFSPATGPIAHARLRLNVSDRDVEIYRGKERLEVRRALELLVVAITNAPARKTPWDELVGNKITVVRSLSWPARWELHTDVRMGVLRST